MAHKALDEWIDTFMPFAEAADPLEELTGVAACNHFCRENLRAVGEVATLANLLPGRRK